MKLLILIHHRFALWNAPAWLTEKLQHEFPQIEVVHLSTYADLDRHISDAEILITWSVLADQIKNARKLRWIHSPAAAVHQLMYPELIESDILLTNAREGTDRSSPSTFSRRSSRSPKRSPTRSGSNRNTCGDRKRSGTNSPGSVRLPEPPSALSA